jgi:hypothetical protein
VSSLEIVLPMWLRERLEEEAERVGLSAEEFVLKVVAERLNREVDPPEVAEVYVKLAEKYLREAEDLLAGGDFVQASEKLWGAALMDKAVAAARGLLLRSHGDLFKFVKSLGDEAGDPELRRLFAVASALHQNFYESWLPPEVVKEYAQDVK